MSTLDRAAYAISSGLGAGFVPIAPGTVGALEGIGIFVLVRTWNLPALTLVLALVILNLGLFAAGVWASSRTCAATGLTDPRQIVIDEVSGQLISLLPLALQPSLSLAGLLISFLLFRFFDIFKPYPIRKLERLHGGLGVMADDALAGIFAALLLWIVQLLGLL